MHPIVKALGVETLARPESETLQRILADPRVASAVHKLLIERFGVEAIERMNPGLRMDLAKATGAVKPNTLGVRWNVGQGAINGQWFIRAVGNNQETFFHGKPEFAKGFKFQGETCPRDIADEYTSVYVWVGGGEQDVELGKANQQPAQVHAPIEGPRR